MLADLVESLTEAKTAGNFSRAGLRCSSIPRCWRARTALTPNKGFEEWGGLLGDEVMATA